MALEPDFQTGLDAYNRGDFATAVREWQPYVDRGDAHAQYNLALIYAGGKGVPQDLAKAADLYRKAAEQGVAAAQYNLGLLYASGQGVPKDPKQAAEWLRKAADQGIVMAEVALARVNDEAEGAARNDAEAINWYRKAAERGVASAAFDLALLYDWGKGAPQDFVEARKWYQRAADAGYPPAMTNLGILYYNAEGEKRDLVQAYAWFARGQKFGDPRAHQLLDITAGRMKPGDVKKAQKLVDEWQPASKLQQVSASAGDNLFKPRPTQPAAPTGPPPGAPPGQTGDGAPILSPSLAAEMPATAPAGSLIQPASFSNAAAPAPAPTPTTGGPKVQDVWTGIDRIIAVGDIHGDYEQFTAVLRSAGLIDSYGNWTGGRTHLVQTGDVVDRGPDSRAIMDLLMKLEKQAAAAGGGVHCLIGNHEAMNIYGDLRYVSTAEFASYRTEAAGANREMTDGDRRAGLTAVATIAAPETIRDGGAAIVGMPEHRAAFGPNGEYGRWIRSHNAVIKIDRTLFVHAGIGPKYADWSLDQINDAVRQELNDSARLRGGITIDQQGPLWYAGLAQGNNPALMDQLLRHFDVDRIAVGHTYANGAITPRYGGKLILVDIGLSRVYDGYGKLGCLEIDRGHAYALHRGQGLELPKDDGQDMVRYLKQAAALDPSPSPLLPRIAKLEAK